MYILKNYENSWYKTTCSKKATKPPNFGHKIATRWVALTNVQTSDEGGDVFSKAFKTIVHRELYR